MGKVIKPDWAWKPGSQEDSTRQIKVIKSERRHKKLRELKRLMHPARRNALYQLKTIGYSQLTGNKNKDIANALWASGLITGGPFGQKTAAVALIEWFKAIPEEKRIKRTKNNNSSCSKVDFYSTEEWRKLRYKVLVKLGRKCQCCGAEPPQVVLHVDHIKPRSLYPHLALSIENLQILCEDCNLGKSNLDDTDFRDSESSD